MSIKKFEKDMLKGRKLQIQKKFGNLSYPIHRHDYFEIIYYCGSKGKCLLNGEEFPIDGRSVFLLTPEDFHRIEADDIKSAYSIKFSFLGEVIDKRSAENFPLSAKVLENPDDFFIATVNALAASKDEEDEFTQIKQYHLLNTLLIEFARKGRTAGKENSYMHPIVGKIMMFALTDPSKDISLDTAAKMCHISPAYFSYIFHAQTGKTCKKWLNEIKIEHACRLLENTSLTVLEISLECGFHNVSHFGKTFKTALGMTPKEYRKCK